MNDADSLHAAEAYLVKLAINYVRPGNVVRRSSDSVEICFDLAEALDPNVIIDPPDVRVVVNSTTGHCSLVPQM